MSTPSALKLAPKPGSRSKSALTVWFLILALCVAALAGTYMLFVEAPPPRHIIIATGSKTGAYYAFAQKYADLLKKEGLTLEVRETKGAVENLQLLNDEGAGVAAAIVQSGVANEQNREHLVSLGSLYREPLWVFYRGETPLFVEQPPPKKIVIATGGKSGAYFQFGEKYAAELKKEGVTLEVRETKGSVQNLQLLNDKASGVVAAIVQSGVANPADREHLVSLGSLYREPLWVFYRGPKIDRLSDLAGKRIGVGPEGSGTYPIAMQLLTANGLVGKVTIQKDPVKVAADQLQEGKLDAAFFVAAIDTDYIKALVRDDNVQLLNFSQEAAYQRQFPFLSGATLPAGLFNLGQNIPSQNVTLVAPTAMLVLRKDAHPSLTALLLTAAMRVHGKGDQLANPGEFPSAAYTDVPVSEEAKQFYKTGSTTLPKLAPVDRLSYFEGKRIGIGKKGSGTYAIAMELLKANGMVGKTTLSEDAADVTVKKLKREYEPKDSQSDEVKELDVAFFVAAPQTGYIQDLMKDPFIRLMSFSQHEAYQRKFRFLSDVTIPAGMVNLGYNIPREDINLVAPTAMLVVRKDLHPALIPVLLNAAARVHAKGDELTTPGEFPSPSFTDIPVSEDAKHFYKSGPPMLQRFLPFWLASMVDRTKIMLIPLIMLMLPLFRAAPPLMAWRTRRKIYMWYAALQEIDRKLVTGLSQPQLEVELARLSVIEHQVTFVEVPLSYMDQLYHLRMHLTMLQDKLKNLRPQQGMKDESKKFLQPGRSMP